MSGGQQHAVAEAIAPVAVRTIASVANRFRAGPAKIADAWGDPFMMVSMPSTSRGCNHSCRKGTPLALEVPCVPCCLGVVERRTGGGAAR